MADFTKKAIKETFMRMLEERPLSAITIKDIVQECGINRNTFYYHYKDLPTLIEEIVKEESDATIEKYNTVSSIMECYDALIEFASSRKRGLMHIYKSINRDVFEQYLMKMCEYFVGCYVEHVVEEMQEVHGYSDINEEDKYSIINYFKCVCFGLVIEWLNTGMSDEQAKSIRRMFKMKNFMEREIMDLFGKQEI